MSRPLPRMRKRNQFSQLSSGASAIVIPKNKVILAEFYSLGHNILALYNVLVQVWLATNKTELDNYYKKLYVPQFPQINPWLKCRISGKRSYQENLKISGTLFSSHSPIQKWNSKFSSLAQVCLLYLSLPKYFVHKCLQKQNFVYKLFHYPKNFNILTYLLPAKSFSNV